MNTLEAKNETAVDRLRTDLEKRGEETAKRENRLLLAVVGTIGFGVAVLAVLNNDGDIVINNPSPIDQLEPAPPRVAPPASE